MWLLAVIIVLLLLLLLQSYKNKLNGSIMEATGEQH